MNDRNTSDHQIFELDLAAHEARRRTEILAALGDLGPHRGGGG